MNSDTQKRYEDHSVNTNILTNNTFLDQHSSVDLVLQ